jgi:uncharacterized protein with PIN domain
LEPRFVVDVNVGRLAKWLRAMGYDTLFTPSGDDNDLVRLALQEGRILLTRDSLLMRRKLATSGRLKALLIRADDYQLQLRQVVEALGLDTGKEFSRCIGCNQPLREVPHHQVQEQVPRYVFQTQEEFKECPACQKIYWRGTHWARMRAELARARQGSNPRAPE